MSVLDLGPLSPAIRESFNCLVAEGAFVSQQIYGYEDLHMLQSRLPLVSIFATHMERLVKDIFACMSSSHLSFFSYLSPLCRITMESHFLAPQQLFPTETGALPTTPTQVKLRHYVPDLAPHPKTSTRPR